MREEYIWNDHCIGSDFKFEQDITLEGLKSLNRENVGEDKYNTENVESDSKLLKECYCKHNNHPKVNSNEFPIEVLFLEAKIEVTILIFRSAIVEVVFVLNKRTQREEHVSG